VRGLAIALLLAVVVAGGLFLRAEIDQQKRATHATGLVQRVLDAETAQVPDIVNAMEDYRRWTDPLLRQESAEAAEGSQRKLHASLALLPVDEEQVDYLYQRLLGAPPEQFPVIRDALRSHQETLTAKLWEVLEDGRQDAERRFRAACALAEYDGTEGGRWRKASPFVVAHLLAAVGKNPSHYPPMLRALRPVRLNLLGALSGVFRGKESTDSERSLASSILADYAGDRPEVLADLLMDAGEKQFAVLFPRVADHRPVVLPLLNDTASRSLESKKSDDEKETLAKRQANAEVALLRLGQAEKVWPQLRHSPDPRVRSYLIHYLAGRGAEAGPLVERLEVEEDVSIRRALVLALGEYRGEQLPAEMRQRLVPRLLAWYRDDPDAGLHGAIDWLLRHGKEGKDDRPLDWAQAKALQQIDEDLAARLRGVRAAVVAGRVGAAVARDLPVPLAWTVEPARPERGWYVNGQGQTLTVVDGQQPFLMGSPDDEAGRRSAEKLHWRRIGRRYAIATKHVTVAQWQRFLKANPVVPGNYVEPYSPVPDCPINAPSWYMAAQYCRWLSEQEGMAEHDMVYPSVADIQKHADGVKPLRLPVDHLKRRGYRLPTEAEHEHACRAGARTSRYYGSSVDLLGRYAWNKDNAQNRTWPVGQNKPNDLGLFDMHGNVWIWCQEGYRDHPEGSVGRPAEDKEDNRDISDRLNRILRGASFRSHPTLLRASFRNDYRPTNRDNAFGVRVARTCD
jgi:formylglycine-generating enzyme required for sulfatase activity